MDVRADRRSGKLVRRVIGAQPPAAKAPQRIQDAVDQAAQQYGVDPLLVHAVIQVESAYNPYAVSHAGAQGLMQLMPATARSLGVRNSFDVEENIRAGVRHLKELKDVYKDDRLALAAYNAGAGAVKKYGTVPPYRETQDYVVKVGQKYGRARKNAEAAKATTPPAPPVAQSPDSEPAPREVEAFVDPQGRLHIRTR